MTIRHCLAAASIALLCAAPLRAQIPPLPPAPPAAPVPAVPPLPPVAPVPPLPPAPPQALHVGPGFNFSHDFDLVLPEFDFHVPDIVWPEVDVVHLEALAENARFLAEEAQARVQVAPVPAPAPPGSAGFVFAGGSRGQQDGLYNQARSFIDRDQYDRAIDSLDRLIATRGARTDAALYWKAYSQLKLARHTDALATLAELRKQFPMSSWVRDANALEVEVRQASGQSVDAAAQASDDLKLLALQGVMRSDPQTAIPVIEKTLAGSSSVRVKERALFVLSQSKEPRARDVIVSTARGATNPDLRLGAIRYLGRMSTPESQQALEDIYRGTSDLETKRAIIQALSSDRTAAAKLVALARVEKSTDLQTEIVRRLSTSQAPEAREYLLELLR
jgi:hypothetical protein